MENQERENVKKLCSFRELFGGRFDDEEVAFLLERFNNVVGDAVSFVLQSEPAEIRQLIEQDRQEWQQVLPNNRRRRLAENIDRVRHQPQSQIMAQARSGRIDTSCRMFSCESCDKFWWRKIPTRKAVSKCDRCRVRKDALPREKEWGWAEFSCESCQHSFAGWCGMWMTSPCYRCQNPVYPTRIVPPAQGAARHPSARAHHQCSAPDCAGRGWRGYPPLASLPMGLHGLPVTCVHPGSRRQRHVPVVVVPSRNHDSTGSTVDTFLPQGDLMRNFEPVPLDTVSEDDE